MNTLTPIQALAETLHQLHSDKDIREALANTLQEITPENEQDAVIKAEALAYNPVKEKALTNTELAKRIYEGYKRIYDTPIDESKGHTDNEVGAFYCGGIWEAVKRMASIPTDSKETIKEKLALISLLLWGGNDTLDDTNKASKDIVNSIVGEL